MVFWVAFIVHPLELDSVTRHTLFGEVAFGRRAADIGGAADLFEQGDIPLFLLAGEIEVTRIPEWGIDFENLSGDALDDGLVAL